MNEEEEARNVEGARRFLHKDTPMMCKCTLYSAGLLLFLEDCKKALKGITYPLAGDYSGSTEFASQIEPFEQRLKMFFE